MSFSGEIEPRISHLCWKHADPKVSWILVSNLLKKKSFTKEKSIILAPIRTDNGHGFQARFHCHCIEKGIEHVYIKPSSPRLNGKVERSHHTDKQEFYQLLDYTNDANLREKIKE